MQSDVEKNFDKLEDCLNKMIKRRSVEKGEIVSEDLAYYSFEIEDRAIRDQQVLSPWIKYNGKYRCRIYYNIYQSYMTLQFNDYSFIEKTGIDKYIEKKIPLINTLINCFSKNSSVLGRKTFDLITPSDLYYLSHQLSTQADYPLQSIEIRISLIYDIINDHIVPVIRFPYNTGNHQDDYFRFHIESHAHLDTIFYEKTPAIMQEKQEIDIIKEIDTLYQDLFFKPIVNKPYDQLTESEKELIEMFYR